MIKRTGSRFTGSLQDGSYAENKVCALFDHVEGDGTLLLLDVDWHGYFAARRPPLQLQWRHSGYRLVAAGRHTAHDDFNHLPRALSRSHVFAAHERDLRTGHDS